MRPPESKIKEVVLHPEEEVRLTALDYFSRSNAKDETIMPLVIEAVEKYGRDRAFRILRSADSLPQTDATVGWLAEELSKDRDLADVDLGALGQQQSDHLGVVAAVGRAPLEGQNSTPGPNQWIPPHHEAQHVTSAACGVMQGRLPVERPGRCVSKYAGPQNY